MNRHLMATEAAHLFLGKLLRPGQVVVDATAGNGKDTLFLAQTVGDKGMVYAFDIQSGALENTKALLQENNCLSQVRLVNDSHENISQYIKPPVHGCAFNLGYLPGGNKEIKTTAETTISALRQCCELLADEGVVSVVAYPGHEHGEAEAAAIEELLKGLPSPPWHVLSWKRVNCKGKAPYLLLAHKHVQRGTHFEDTQAKEDNRDY